MGLLSNASTTLLTYVVIDSKLMLKFVKNRVAIWRNRGTIWFSNLEFLVCKISRLDWEKSWYNFLSSSVNIVY